MIGLIPRDHWEHNLGDLFIGLKAALTPNKQSKIFQIPDLGNSIPVRSGRAGLVAAIRTLRLAPGARIGVPLYCCPVVFKAIAAAGCRPCFIDIEPDTFCMSTEDLSAKSSQLDAIIAVHMFGNLCDIHRLKEAAQGKLIIEDCAQALGSKIGGRFAGSFGDIAFFSFRSGKYLSVGEGGALFSTDSEVSDRISQFINKMPTPGRAEECIHAVKNYIKSILRSKPLYGVVGFYLWDIFGKKMNLSEKSGVALSQIYKTDFAIIRKRLALLDALIKRQRDNAKYYSKALKLESGMLCWEKSGAFYNRYHYPITFNSTDNRDYIASYLLSRQIDTMKYLDGVVDIAAKNYGYAGDCQVAEQLSKKVLIIPSYYSLRKRDVKHIAQCLNEGWTEISKCGSSTFS